MSVWINGHCIDGSGSLSRDSIEAWCLPRDLSAEEAEQVNEAIGEWEEADPDGYDDTAARRLDERVAEIISARESSEDGG